MIRYGAYVLLCLSIAISFWFFGFQSPLTYVLGINPSIGQAYSPDGSAAYAGQALDTTSFVQRLGQVATSSSEIVKMLGIAAAVVIIASLTGFSSMYFLPIVFLLFITNYVAMPITNNMLGTTCSDPNNSTTCVSQPGIPAFIYYPMLILMNSLCVMASMSFIRGGV